MVHPASEYFGSVLRQRQAAAELPIDQARDRPYSLSMKASVVPVCLREGLIASHASDGVFHNDAALGKGAVVGHVFRWAFLT